MKTPVKLIQDIFSLLDVPAVKSSISGGVYPGKRPDGSRKEDVVVNCLPVTGDQLQRGIVNVNIHVPNLEITISGHPDNSQPDLKRIEEIYQVVEPIIENGIKDNTDVSIQQAILIEEGNEHYLNIRLLTHTINL